MRFSQTFTNVQTPELITSFKPFPQWCFYILLILLFRCGTLVLFCTITGCITVFAPFRRFALIAVVIVSITIMNIAFSKQKEIFNNSVHDIKLIWIWIIWWMLTQKKLETSDVIICRFLESATCCDLISPLWVCTNRKQFLPQCCMFYVLN